MRAPVVAGAGGGVGTTTVAVGLRGHDAGRLAGLPPGRWPDILVCRGTLDSMRRAAEVLDGAAPGPPVLAVTLVGGTPRGPLRARLDLLEADAAALVLLPRVRRWATLVDPLAEVAQLLVEPPARLPRAVRAYATALRELAAAVAASGRLAHDAAQRPPRPPGPGPVPPGPARPHPDEQRPPHGSWAGPPARREAGGVTGPALEPADRQRPRRGVQIVAAGRVEQAG